MTLGQLFYMEMTQQDQLAEMLAAMHAVSAEYATVWHHDYHLGLAINLHALLMVWVRTCLWQAIGV